MKKITKNLIVIGAVAAIAIGGTIAYFSDTETSIGNIFTAGGIDLKIDNESYRSDDTGRMVLSGSTTWAVPADLEGQLFFNFDDLKPGDLGEDTVSLHLLGNDSWLCVDFDITANNDLTCTEPELADDPDCAEPGENLGELAENLNFMFWADDGDNVLEDNESVLTSGPASDILGDVTYALADSQTNIWGQSGPFPAGVTKYIGKAWCFGEITADAVAQGDNSPTVDPGVNCDGSLIDNAAQTDSLMGDITFRAVQARNNNDFRCGPSVGDEPGTLTVIKHVVGGTNVAGDFTMNVTGTNVSDVDFPGAESPGTTVTLDAGSYSVDETGPGGYTKGLSADCSGTIAAGESKTCTITNAQDTGKIIVNKVVNNYEVGTKQAGDFQMKIDGSDVTQSAENVVPTGAHVVSETADPDYTTTIGGDCDPAGNVTVGKDETKTCTVTNDAKYGTITVTKTVNNGDGGLLTVGDFTLRTDGVVVVSGVSKNVAVGAHIVSEDGIFGYSATFSGDCDSSGNVNVAAGENKACAIDNNDIRPSITIIKNVVGGSAVPDDFDVSIDHAIKTSGSSNSASANTAHVIDEEVAVSGYSFTSLTGTSFLGVPCPTALEGTITLLPGDVVTCTITNTHQ